MCVIMEMKKVGIRELRQNLSQYVREVTAGETFCVTDRGHAVATLGPAPGEVDVVERLITRGQLRPARLDLLQLGPPPAAACELPISQALAELRDEDG